MLDLELVNFIIAFGLAVAMAIMLARLFAGPTLYDRTLAANSFGTKTVIFLLVFSALVGRGDAIDIALLYALINFVATIAILKFFRYRSLDIALAQMSLRKAVEGDFDK
ncbi:monovalent cation/H+ antiporter complex subunit F [Maricaulis sp. D1M11]|uniref:monovalent cation/H+ antiporter complex subunit F n=1 Tax=Maricaulis sp. D1M11 TaxID=3076117 RepID=UPI0039B5E655